MKSWKNFSFMQTHSFYVTVLPEKIVNSLDYRLINNAMILNNISLDLDILEKFLFVMTNLIMFLSSPYYSFLFSIVLLFLIDLLANFYNKQMLRTGT